jgi:hypothetical protein
MDLPMDLSTISQKAGLNQAAIKYLQKNGVISAPPTDYDLHFMVTLAQLWGKPGFVKLQVSRYNTSSRARIVMTAGLNRIESHLLSRWIGHYVDRGDAEDYKTSLHIEQVTDEAMTYLGINPQMRNGVAASTRKMRTKARNLFYRYERTELIEVMRALTEHKKSRKPAKKSQERAVAASAEQRRKAMENLLGL